MEEAPVGDGGDEPPSADTAGAASVTIRGDAVPDDLGPDIFFERLITRALDRMPVSVYDQVRRCRAEAAGSG
jgi:hypothetical protein